jgi:hypothetical protein
MTLFAQSGATIGAIVLAMIVVALIETVIPLHVGERSNRAHLGPNLAHVHHLRDEYLPERRPRLDPHAACAPRLWRLERVPQAPLVGWQLVLVLDLSFYVAHVAMHKVPAF